MNAAAKLTETVTVDNPYFDRARSPNREGNPREIEAVRSLHTPLLKMRKRGTITDTQCRAGLRYYAIFRTQQGGMKSPGHIQEPVDGDRAARDPLTERQERAGREIKRIEAMLEGLRPIRMGRGTVLEITRLVCCGELTLRQIQRKFKIGRQKAKKAMRTGLDALAKEFGW